jgi:uncharacterized protein (TIGR03067 family)
MVAMEGDGRDAPDAARKALLFDGTNYYFLFDGKKGGGPDRIVIDPSKSPKWINVISGRGTQLGIYRFTTEGELQICLNQPQGRGSDRRPTKFTTKPTIGAGSILYTLKKTKDE